MMNKAKDIVLIGGSAGSYTLIVQILEALPQRFDAAIAIVIHRNPRFTTKIEETLSIKLRRSVIQPRDKTAIAPNIIYFAGPGYHLLVEPDWTFSVDVSERIHFSRPSIDVLFDTAAEVYQDRCTAFLLSGANQDGADGIRRVRDMGEKRSYNRQTTPLLQQCRRMRFRQTQKVTSMMISRSSLFSGS